MNWTLLHKYLSGECSPTEKEKVEDWISSDKRNREFYDSLVKIWSVEPNDNIKVDAKIAWESFKEKLADEEEKEQRSQQIITDINNIRSESLQRKGYGRPIAVSIAAAAVAVTAVLFYIFVPDTDLFNDQQAAQEKSQQVQEISTALGQRTSFRLSDGTHVYLNADSRVKVLPAFGDSVRSIQLEGEAYFDVAHNGNIPFLVHSGGSYTKVLGTKFGVKAYPQDEGVQVVVEEGKVALGSSGELASEDVRLTKNQVGLWDADGKISMKNIEGIANYLAWKDGRLVFDSTSFEKVVPQLERWYNIEIEADPSLTSQQVTASFDDEPMLEVLNILALSLDARFQRDGRKISFNSK